jgi:AcrR family transcriptional regulator
VAAPFHQAPQREEQLIVSTGEHVSDRGRADKRTDIIRAALRCFSRKGYNNTTMDDIVAESGLSKGTLYWYFDSKEKLFEDALLSLFVGFGEDVTSMLDRCQSATEKLRCLCRGAAAFSDSVGAYFSLFLEFWVSRPNRDEATQVWDDLLEEYKTILAAVVEEGIEAGEFRPVAAEPLVWALMATYDGLAAYTGFVPDLDLERISQTFTDVVLNGLTLDAHDERPSGGV